MLGHLIRRETAGEGTGLCPARGLQGRKERLAKPHVDPMKTQPYERSESKTTAV